MNNKKGHTTIGVPRSIFCKNSYKGQVTIFIVVGILLISSISIFFLYRQGLIPTLGGGKEINPNEFLKDCLEEKAEEAIEIVSMQGGSINPKLNKKFKFDADTQYWNITYLCYTQNYYAACINQEPILIRHIEKEIKDHIEDEVQICFDELKNSLEKQNYDVKKKYNGLNVSLSQRKMQINIKGELDLTKNEESSKLKNFGIKYPSMLYDLAIVAQEIVAQEAEYCYFNYVGYPLMYPEFQIEIYEISGTHIYTVKWRENQDKFRFAVQGCRS